MLVEKYSLFLEELKLRIKKLSGDRYYAYHKNKKVGVTQLEYGKLSAHKSVTHPDYRRKGVMTALYNHIEKERGEKMSPSDATTDDSFHFWNKRDPESMKNDMRRHRENLMGKEVKCPHSGEPATITNVGPGGAVATYQSNNRTTTYLNRKALVKQGLHKDD